MAEFGEDVQGQFPGVAGLRGIAGGVVGVPEVAQRNGPVVAVTGFLVQPHRVPVTVDSLPIMPEVVVGVAEIVPCGRFRVSVAELPLAYEGLLAVGLACG